MNPSRSTPLMLWAAMALGGCSNAEAYTPLLVGLAEVLSDEPATAGSPTARSTPRPARTELPDDPAAIPYKPRWTEADEPGEPDLEALIVAYTNDAREAEGLPPLTPHPSLHVAARQHSREMIEREYYAHDSPVSGHRTPSQRARLAGYWSGAGENIYDFRDRANPEATARGLVDGWMKSPGHRRNILDKHLHLGVGVFHRGERLMATQVFGSQALDIVSLTVAAEPEGIRLRARAKAEPATRFRSAHVRVGREVQTEDPIAFEPGDTFRFSALVPRGGTHTVYLNLNDPADNGQATWPTPLIHVDTEEPLTRAVTAYDER